MGSPRDGSSWRADARWWGTWSAFLLVLGFVGPRTRNEVHDLVAVVVLVALARMTAARHELVPILVIERLVERLERWKRRLQAASPSLGVDLRGDPPIPSRVPRLFLAPAAAVVCLAVFLVVRPFPSDATLLGAARRFAYAPYVLGLALYWLTLLLLVAAGGYLVTAALRDAYRNQRPESGHALRRVPPAVVLVAVAAICLLVTFVPVRFAFAWVFVAIALDLAIIWLPGQGTLRLLWRRTDGHGAYRSIDWRALSSFELPLLLGALGLPLLVPDPGEPIAADWSVAPITRALFGLATWGAALSMLVVVYLRLHLLTRATLQPPSLPVRRRIHLEARDPALLRRARPLLVEDGWDVVERGPRHADDVGLRLCESAADADPSSLPLGEPVPIDLLEDSEVRWRLRRRADIRSRRNLMKGLETIFRHAARADRSVGSGFVLGPHQWFLIGLERDVAGTDHSEDASDLGHIHPSYRAVMTRRARHHLWTILSSVGVDLIRVEYGISFRTLRVVLRIVFEVYDVHGGERQVDERDFVAVHGVRVIIDGLDLEHPRISQLYPEPEFEQGSRARILNLYRDRGGEEEPVEAPVWSDGLPVST